MTPLKNCCAVCSHWNMRYKTDSDEERTAALRKKRICLINNCYGLMDGDNCCNYFKEGETWYARNKKIK